jgi:hypothetical protein
MRRLQELSQSDRSKRTCIPQSALSGIENNRMDLDVEQAKVLEKARKCRPAVLVFPGRKRAA